MARPADPIYTPNASSSLRDPLGAISFEDWYHEQTGESLTAARQGNRTPAPVTEATAQEELRDRQGSLPADAKDVIMNILRLNDACQAIKARAEYDVTTVSFQRYAVTLTILQPGHGPLVFSLEVPAATEEIARGEIAFLGLRHLQARNSKNPTESSTLSLSTEPAVSIADLDDQAKSLDAEVKYEVKDLAVERFAASVTITQPEQDPIVVDTTGPFTTKQKAKDAAASLGLQLLKMKALNLDSVKLGQAAPEVHKDTAQSDRGGLNTRFGGTPLSRQSSTAVQSSRASSTQLHTSQLAASNAVSVLNGLCQRREMRAEYVFEETRLQHFKAILTLHRNNQDPLVIRTSGDASNKKKAKEEAAQQAVQLLQHGSASASTSVPPATLTSPTPSTPAPSAAAPEVNITSPDPPSARPSTKPAQTQNNIATLNQACQKLGTYAAYDFEEPIQGLFIAFLTIQLDLGEVLSVETDGKHTSKKKAKEAAAAMALEMLETSMTRQALADDNDGAVSAASTAAATAAHEEDLYSAAAERNDDENPVTLIAEYNQARYASASPPIYRELVVRGRFACELTLPERSAAPFGDRGFGYASKKHAKMAAAREAVVWLKASGEMGADGKAVKKRGWEQVERTGLDGSIAGQRKVPKRKSDELAGQPRQFGI